MLFGQAKVIIATCGSRSLDHQGTWRTHAARDGCWRRRHGLYLNNGRIAVLVKITIVKAVLNMSILACEQECLRACSGEMTVWSRPLRTGNSPS